MKKIGILNQPLSAAIAGLGHTDTLVIADAGLPIPPETQRIDLALTRGIPSFLDALRAVLTEMQVEQATVAEDIGTGLCRRRPVLSAVPPVFSHRRRQWQHVNQRHRVQPGRRHPCAHQP